MAILFASFYFVPAAFLGLGIWMAMKLLRALGVGFKGRRLAFTILVTVLLAPSVVPAGIIMAALVPNGVLVLTGSLPIHHEPRLVNFAAISFLGTAIASGLVAYFFVNDKKHRRTSPLIPSLVSRIAFPVGVIAALLAVFYGLTPNRKIPPHIDWALIESVYGERLDTVMALAEIEDLVTWQAERNRLESLYSEDPLVLRITFSDRRLENMMSGRTLNLGNRFEGSCSSIGDGKWRNDRMMRCSRGSGVIDRNQTLKYRRRSVRVEHKIFLEIEFDYDKLLAQFSADESARLTTGDEQEAAKYDSVIQGTWSIRQRYQVTANEERYQTGTLEVGPRQSLGTYSVAARVKVEGVLRKGKDKFSRKECNQSERACTWSESYSGTLRVRGSRVQITYNNSRWMSDRLEIGTGKMTGIDDWGKITIFERVIVEPDT